MLAANQESRFLSKPSARDTCACQYVSALAMPAVSGYVPCMPPPDLLEVLSPHLRVLRGRLFDTATLLIGVGWLAWSALYTVPSDSVGVIQRFGRYIRQVDQIGRASCRERVYSSV